VLAAAALGLGPQTATAGPADTTEACLADHEASQRARDEGQLLRARETLQRCAVDTCPQLVRRDCLNWLADVDSALPSIAVSVIVAGKRKDPDAFWIDDEAIEIADLGTAIELDPGVHRFRARARIGDEDVEREVELVIQPSVRRQAVRIELEVERVEDPAGVGAGTAGPPGAADTRIRVEPKTLRVAGWATLGAGVGLGAVALGTGISGLRARSSALGECAPFCSSQRAGSIRARILVADIAGPLAGALLVTSVVLLALGFRKPADKRVGVTGDGLLVRF
jgi:hypothetical protein